MMRVAHRTPRRRVYVHHVSTLRNGFINWLGNRGWKRVWMCRWSRCRRALMWRIGHSKTRRREIGEKKCLFLIVDWWRWRRLDSRTKQTCECVCLFFFCWRNVTWQMIFFGSLTLLLLWKSSSSCAATFRFLNGFFRLFFFLCYFIGSWWKAIGQQFIIWISNHRRPREWAQREKKKTNTNRREELNKSSLKGEIQLLDCCWFYLFLVVPSNFFFPVLKVQSTLVGWLRNRFPGSLKQKWNSYTKERKKENCLDQM